MENNQNWSEAMEDLFDADEAIEVRDAIQLWESDYYEDAKRWIKEAAGGLSGEAYQTAEELRVEMFRHCVNDKPNTERIKELADDLSTQINDMKMRLELVEKIADKAKEYDYCRCTIKMLTAQYCC